MKTIKKYKHFLPVVVYGIFYLKCFQYLETPVSYTHLTLPTIA